MKKRRAIRPSDKPKGKKPAQVDSDAPPEVAAVLLAYRNFMAAVSELPNGYTVEIYTDEVDPARVKGRERLEIRYQPAPPKPENWRTEYLPPIPDDEEYD